MKIRIEYVFGPTVLLIYTIGGLFIYRTLEKESDWTYIDCLYFLSATMSTVGYGDLSPSTESSRWFTLVMIIVGISLVFPYIGTVLLRVTSPITAKGREMLESLFPQRTIDIDGDGTSDYKIPRHPVIYYSKNLLPSFALTLLVQFISAAIFCAIEREWTFGDAFYHCIVTATTVGRCPARLCLSVFYFLRWRVRRAALRFSEQCPGVYGVYRQVYRQVTNPLLLYYYY